MGVVWQDPSSLKPPCPNCDGSTFEPGQVIELDFRRKEKMTLTGKVTSVHAGSRFVDGQRRVTVSVSEDKGSSYHPLADITLRSETLMLEQSVWVDINPIPEPEIPRTRSCGIPATDGAITPSVA